MLLNSKGDYLGAGTYIDEVRKQEYFILSSDNSNSIIYFMGILLALIKGSAFTKPRHFGSYNTGLRRKESVLFHAIFVHIRRVNLVQHSAKVDTVR